MTTCIATHIEITQHEADDLTWVAARYLTAEWLTDRMESVVDGELYHIIVGDDEGQEYLDLLADENGNPGQTLPTCIGGELGDKLNRLYDRLTN